MPDVHPTHPLHGARPENTTGQHLAAGLVSVFDGGRCADDAQPSDAPSGDTRFVTYTLNQDVQVDAGSGQVEETVQTGTIVDGALTITRRRVVSQTYTIENDTIENESSAELSSTEAQIEPLSERISTLTGTRADREDRLGKYLQDLTVH
jgi:hypothetical protein